MNAIVVIPARYSSSRYPGKPLVNLLNKPMIIWVAELSERAVGKENVYIATDDERIKNVVESFGFQVIMTSTNCLTGTDRLAEVALQIDADIYINVQGDEPLVKEKDILQAIQLKTQYMNEIVNGFCWLSAEEDANNVNIPKVITNEKNQLIYMSRLPIPGFKELKNAPKNYKKQVCIYAFTKEELISFKNFGRKSNLEFSEDIEILRFLDLNKSIRMFETQTGSLAVDTPEDVILVEKALMDLYNL